jgi:hypothetical protein
MANVPSSLILVTLMMEALSSSEMSVLTRATRRNTPEDGILQRTVIFQNIFFVLSFTQCWSCSWICNRQSVGQYVCQAALWGPWPDFTCSLVWHVLLSSCRAQFLTRGLVCILHCTSLTGQSHEGPITMYYCLIWDWVPFLSPLMTRRITVEVY